MTGQLTVVDADAPLPTHTHLVFDLDDGRAAPLPRHPPLRQRHACSTTRRACEAFFDDNGLGPEPFDLDAASLARRPGRDRGAASRPSCSTRRVVAGVGNIYADESLFLARLHPARRGCDL